MSDCVSDISFCINAERGMEQLQRSDGLFSGLESCELYFYRPGGGDANGTQHTEAGSGFKARTSLSGQNEGPSIYNRDVHRC